MVAAAKLSVDTTASAMDMANAMFGDGVTILTATYSGDDISSGIYTNGDATSPTATPSDSGVILSTGAADDYTNSSGDSNQSKSTFTKTDGIDGDADMDAVASTDTYDAAIFEASFTSTGDALTMQFIFSSEEYLEFVSAGYNDAIGIWVNGVKAEISIGTGQVSVDDINDTTNENLFLDNAGDAYNTEMDGLTITLTIKAPLNTSGTNTIKIGIADAGDDRYDSNLLIVGNSVQSVAIAVDDTASVNQNAAKTIDVLDNDTVQTGLTVTITHINDVAVNAGDSVTLPTGEIITLNADGTLTAQVDSDVGINIFTYAVEDSDGNTDVGFVSLETTVPCFVAGARVETDKGVQLIEDLCAGDRIKTKNGYKVLRWVGSRFARCHGAHAPVVFEANSLGQHDAFELSQQHRVLRIDFRAEMLFGKNSVLVRAKDLINGKSIRLNNSGKPVQYFHLLFDQHEVVKADGVWSESFQPGAQILTSMDATSRAEVLDLFPNLDAETGEGYGPECYPSLRSYEARVLLG